MKASVILNEFMADSRIHFFMLKLDKMRTAAKLELKRNKND